MRCLLEREIESVLDCRGTSNPVRPPVVGPMLRLQLDDVFSHQH